MKVLIILTLCCLTTLGLNARENYQVETIPQPADPDLNGQIDGLAFMPDGRLAACFSFGKVYLYNPVTTNWSLFAEGLHNPLGIVAIDNHSMFVAQRPEITRLVDEDGDGLADLYETVCDDFGISGNYHEFHFGPTQDREGNLFASLGTASSGDGIRDEVRGTFYYNSEQYYNDLAITPEPFSDMLAAFNQRKPGRMYSSVPYRGWMIKVTPDGEMIPFASGLRTPNGVGFDLEGRLFCTDNQGDWLGSSKLFHIQQDRFYGHAGSLPWTEGFRGHPLATPVDTLDAMRTRAAVVFPHGIMANSPTEPLVDNTAGKFGPFAGQLFVGDMNRSRIMRVMLEDVGGEVQGACIPFYDDDVLGRGCSRFAFDASGALWVGQTKHTWAGGQGLQRITWDGATPFEVLNMQVTEDGFRLTFTEPLDPVTAVQTNAWKMKRYYYRYHEAYGSPQFGLTKVPVVKVTLSADHRVAELHLSELAAWHLHELTIEGVQSEAGRSLANNFMVYTLNRLLKDTPPPPADQRAGAGKPGLLKPGLWGKSAAAKAKAEEPSGGKNPLPGVYEAEKATFQGAGIAKGNSGFYGKGFVDFTQDDQAFIEWTIDVKTPGQHHLFFRYALKGNRRLKLLVNGSSVAKPLPFSDTGGWIVWKDQAAEAVLKKGANTIRLEAIGQSGPNIDALRIERFKAL
jgi:glucose/arabinose dehydrogenase